MHICASAPTIIDSDHGSSPNRHQAIIWANVGILLIEHLRTSMKIHTFSFKKINLKNYRLENGGKFVAALMFNRALFILRVYEHRPNQFNMRLWSDSFEINSSLIAN